MAREGTSWIGAGAIILQWAFVNIFERIIMAIWKNTSTRKTVKKTAAATAVTIFILEAAIIGGIMTANSPAKTQLNSFDSTAYSSASGNNIGLSNETTKIANIPLTKLPDNLNNSDNTVLYWQNVKAFGAKGDGTTDDTKAIQDAINAGMHIFFPVGTYIVDQITISNVNGYVIWGYGATIKKKAGSVIWTRILDITSTKNMTILGLTLDGNKQNVSGSPKGGCGSIYAKGLTNFLFRDMRICNSLYGPVILSDCHYGDIVNTSFDDIDVGVLGMNLANSYIDINNCSFTNGTSEGISFGIYTAITAGDFKKIGYHNNINITNCRFLNKNANCIQLRNVKNVLILNNSLERSDTTKATTGIVIDPDAVTGVDIVPDNVIIQSNLIKGMRFEGILITKGTNMVVKDNYFDSVQSFNITSKCACIIKNNVFVNIQPGVQTISALSNDIKILDNYFKLDSVPVPCVIRISSATAGIEIIGNNLSKSISNNSLYIAYSNSSPSACIILDNYGL